jgi:hypothetical protein
MASARRRVTGPGARLAEVLIPIEAETPFGGWSRTLQSVGWAWVRMETVQRQLERQDGALRSVEQVQALARIEGPLRTGRTLRLDGTDWTIVEIVADGQQFRLRLEHDRVEREG